MARSKKDTRTELQKAAGRVAEMEVAVANTERDLSVAMKAYAKTKLAFEQARRDVADTGSLLFARKEKLHREREAVAGLL